MAVLLHLLCLVSEYYINHATLFNIDVAICGSMAVNVAHNAAQTKLKEVVMHWLFQIQECVTALDC